VKEMEGCLDSAEYNDWVAEQIITNTAAQQAELDVEAQTNLAKLQAGKKPWQR
jgi:hypothetical protein